ncbi:MAG: GatB/YqeY domain-containing protein [Kiritimatiellia bacterium]
MSQELADRIAADVKTAMKAGEKNKVTALRMLQSAIKDQTVNAGREITEEIVSEVVNKAVKQRADSIEQFRSAGREDLVAKEQAEMEWLKVYQPEQMDEAAIEVVVRECIEETGAESRRDMGKVMKVLMPRVKGRADGKVVNNIVQRLLG